MDQEIVFLSNISKSPYLTQFLHDCVDDMIGRKLISFDNYSNEIEWTQEDYNKARRFIQNLYQEKSLINKNFDTLLEMLSSEAQSAIKKCYEIRQNEIKQSIIKKKIIDSKINLVENFDWKLKWVIGSSKLATLRETLLQLDLHCVSDHKSTINFEMNLEQVDKLINDLESVKAELDKL